MGRLREQHPDLAAYLERGVSRRYLTAHRALWYRQEQRPAAPILCTYMGRQNGGRAIRFLRNRSDATAPNVYLMLYPKPPLEAEARRRPEVIDDLQWCNDATSGQRRHRPRSLFGGTNPWTGLLLADGQPAHKKVPGTAFLEFQAPFSAGGGRMGTSKRRSATMSIADLIPAVRALPHSEKVELARMLLDELAGEELLSGIEQGQEFPIYTPEFAPGAAAQLAALLEAHGKQPGARSSSSRTAIGTRLRPAST